MVRAFRRAEIFCITVLEKLDIDLDQNDEIQRRLSRCMLGRSQCHFWSQQFEEGYRCCVHVVEDTVSNAHAKIHAAIQGGKCLVQLSIKKENEESMKLLLEESLRCSDIAEEWSNFNMPVTQKSELVGEIRQLREDVAKKQLLQVDCDCPKWPKGLYPINMNFQRVQAHHKDYPLQQIDVSEGLKTLHPPLRACYTDYLERRHRHWPSNIDGLLASVDEVTASIVRKCDFVAHARVFCKQGLQQRLQQQRPQRIAFGGGASYSMVVSAPARMRVGCNLVARVALNIASTPGSFQNTNDCYRLAEAITARVYGGYCKRVQVRCCKSEYHMEWTLCQCGL